MRVNQREIKILRYRERLLYLGFVTMRYNNSFLLVILNGLVLLWTLPDFYILLRHVIDVTGSTHFLQKQSVMFPN